MKSDYSWQATESVLPRGHHHTLADLLRRHTSTADPTPAPMQIRPDIPVDVKDDVSEVVVYADMPGVDEDDIHLSLESNILLIQANREFDHDNEDSEDYVSLERAFGPYERALNVPGSLDPVGMTARYKRGVLKVRIPKKVTA